MRLKLRCLSVEAVYHHYECILKNNKQQPGFGIERNGKANR